MYSGLRGEQDDAGGPSKAMLEGRKRGVLFDVGHDGGSFTWGVAVPLMKAGFVPDSITKALHFDKKDRFGVVARPRAFRCEA